MHGPQLLPITPRLPEFPVVSGVYAIAGPEGVYVGEAADCWHRSTLALAVRLGLDCGVVREMPGSTARERQRAETAVAYHFLTSGLMVVSAHYWSTIPGFYSNRHLFHPGRDHY